MLTEKENPLSAGDSIIRVASNGDADAMRALLAEGADVNQRGQGGHTALMVAAIFCHVDIARLLIEAGADVHLQDNLGLTARDWADRRGSWDVAQLLSNAPPAKIESPRTTSGRLSQFTLDAERQNSEIEPKATSQQDSISGKQDQMRTKADWQPREVEETHASDTEPKSPTQRDAVRFMKFHKQIMAAQARQKAELEHQEARLAQRSSPIEPNIESQPVSLLSERKAVPPPSTTGPSPNLEKPPVLSEREAVATRSAVGPSPNLGESPLLSEPEAVATRSTTGPSPKLEKPPLLSEPEPVPTRSGADPSPKMEQPPLLSEPEAVATRSAAGPSPNLEESPFLSKPEAVPTRSGADPSPKVEQPPLLSEREAVATRSTTGAPHKAEEVHQASTIETKTQQDDPKVIGEQQRTSAGQDRREKEVRPTARQSARIAATVQHLRKLEESSKPAEGKVSAKSNLSGPAELRKLDSNDPDTTLDRHLVEIPTRPAVLKPKILGPFIPPPFKSCPDCHTVFDNPQVKYCAYDGTKLIRADDPITFPAGRDWSRQTLLALVVIITALGGLLGYLINNYRARDIVDSAEIPASPSTNQTDQQETTPVVSGALTGMEVDVPSPEYPPNARAEGVAGSVTVRVQVNRKGKVVRARSSGGDSRLRAAAVSAARRASFSEEKLASHGGVVSGTITYNFVVQEKSPAATGSPVPAQTNSPSPTESFASTSNAGGDSPVVGGPLLGTESNLPRPDYPERAKSKGIAGTITVVVRVNRAGKVISWRTLDGNSQLRAAALKAAKKATFAPEKLPGRGEVVGTITYNFKS